MPEYTDEEMLSKLGVTIAEPQKGALTAHEERILAGFEDIERFVEEHGHPPRHGEDLDIFERLYAVRLDRIKSLPEAVTLLESGDSHGLLADRSVAKAEGPPLRDDELLALLGVEVTDEENVAVLRNVLSREEKRAAEEIANRTVCEDFDDFRAIFDKAQSELSSGLRRTSRFSGEINIQHGEFFIVSGQLAYVAERGTTFKTGNGEPDARLRLIYSNGTESNLLMRSLQKALYKDEGGRRLSDPNKPSLFGEEWDAEDVLSGTIYVLRSDSDEPFVVQNREILHKIGVTGGKVSVRIANAAQDATFLLANVEIVATYEMSGINRHKLEQMLHRVFAPGQVDLTIADRFGNPVQPKEWFLVPLPVIDEVINRIKDGSITAWEYSSKLAQLVPRPSGQD